MADPLEAALALHKERKDYEIEPVLAHELLLKRNQLCKLPKDFYHILKESMKDMDDRNRSNTEVHLVSLLRLRTGKIVELACASKEYDAFADVLTDEEQKLFEQLVRSIALLKKEVMQGADVP